MKKRIANLLFLLSILIGVGMGFVRSNIFLKHYDGFTGFVLNTASLSLTLLTAFLVIFAIAVFIICRRFFSSCQISRKLSLIDKILILVGSVSIGISAYLAFTMQGGFFEKTFAVSAVVAIIYFALVVMNAKGTMVDLLSCASVLPAALILLSIYKTNIRFPNISLFAFEVLAALFLILGRLRLGFRLRSGNSLLIFRGSRLRFFLFLLFSLVLRRFFLQGEYLDPGRTRDDPNLRSLLIVFDGHAQRQNREDNHDPQGDQPAHQPCSGRFSADS